MTGFIPRPHRPQLGAPHRRFGEYVRQVRRDRGMTLRRFGQAVGLAPGHVSNIENFRVTPPEEATIVKMAEVLDVPVGALLSRAGKLSPDDLQRFWASPLIPSLIMATTGWTPEEASMFQETILASLGQSTPA